MVNKISAASVLLLLTDDSETTVTAQIVLHNTSLVLLRFNSVSHLPLKPDISFWNVNGYLRRTQAKVPCVFDGAVFVRIEMM